MTALIEPLEPRRLLSAELQYTGVLFVRGTDAADRVALRRRGDRLVLTENGARTTYPAADVAAVIVDAAGGDNRVTVAASVAQACTLTAGGGDDVLVGGRGDDTLDGGGGADRLAGGPGDDNLHAGTGRDRLAGGPGNDTLTAGPAGGTGTPEPLIPADDAGPDRLAGGPGADLGRYDRRTAAAAGGVESRVFLDAASPAGVAFGPARHGTGWAAVTVAADGSATADVGFMLSVRYEATVSPARAAGGRAVAAVLETFPAPAAPGDVQAAVSEVGARRTVDLGRPARGRHTFVLTGADGRPLAEADFVVRR